MEELKQQVLDLTRQFSALQRQLQMQGEVSQVAASIEGRLDEVARDLGELGLRARAEDLKKSDEEASRLKEVLIERIDLKSDPLDGIIAHLTRECGGNVHEKGVVNDTASACYGLSYTPDNAADLGSDLAWWSPDSPNSWLCYDFGGRRVTPTSYSIRSYVNYMGTAPRAFPRSWVLEGSNDEDVWEVLDSRKNNRDLNDYGVTRNFAIKAPPSGAFRFVRLRQTGKNCKGLDCLIISGLELFGVLSGE